MSEKVKASPILFSGPMIRALLAGTKTQTRRILKPQPTETPVDGFLCVGWDKKTGATMFEARCNGGPVNAFKEGPDCVSPYPRVRFFRGQRLYVRETCLLTTTGVLYRADCLADSHTGWRPSIHMPRSASRLWLDVTDVRVERLQDISREDAVAEGLVKLPATGRYVVTKGDQYFGGAAFDPREVYRSLWEEINGPTSWDANPWIVAVSFTVHCGNVDQARAAA